MKRLDIQGCSAEQIKSITERNTTVRLEEHLASLSEEVIANIMADQMSVMALIVRLEQLVDSPYSIMYGGWYQGEMIAYVAFTEMEACAEVHVEVLPEYQGQGFASELLSRTVEMIFSENRYPYLQYTVIPSNLPSIALVEKLGGALQKPASYVEEMLLKTYVIQPKS